MVVWTSTLDYLTSIPLVFDMTQRLLANADQQLEFAMKWRDPLAFQHAEEKRSHDLSFELQDHSTTQFWSGDIWFCMDYCFFLHSKSRSSLNICSLNIRRSLTFRRPHLGTSRNKLIYFPPPLRLCIGDPGRLVPQSFFILHAIHLSALHPFCLTKRLFALHPEHKAMRGAEACPDSKFTPHIRYSHVDS